MVLILFTKCHSNIIKSSIFIGCFSSKNNSMSTRKPTSPGQYDVVVVGGGIVGVATAREIKLNYPSMKICVVEKEKKLGFHQTGHNSGVVHAGIYYTPGTLKAKLCVEGMNLAYAYFDKQNIPYKKCGKLIVALNDKQLEPLHELYERALQNNVKDVRLVSGDEMKTIEPYCKGLEAIHSPNTGIVDWGMVARVMGDDFEQMGGELKLGQEVESFHEQAESVVIKTKQGEHIESSYALICAGLQADEMAVKSGCDREPAIVPFRGEYLLLNPDKQHLVRGNIYPVPDPRFPFLGVHFTPRMDGSVWLGPNAVLAFRKEGYRWSDFSFSELFRTLKYPGFWKLALKYTLYGSKEMIMSWFPRLRVNELKQYIDQIEASDIKRGPSGVRAQALSTSGELVDDFVFQRVGRILHCRNAPSPGATSSLAIAKHILDKLRIEFGLDELSDNRGNQKISNEGTG
uniref:L-2-hydroxyglutarate dehydrogenase, mitochondrial n=1 Tax=Cacopsylla melanoneura TaxID=428564 RepID=A0A8D8XMN9_9HEMI